MSLPFEKRNDLINGIEVYGTIGVFSKDSFALPNTKQGESKNMTTFDGAHTSQNSDRPERCLRNLGFQPQFAVEMW
jgi:hypothetical protein